jgi:hypothetical protein
MEVFQTMCKMQYAMTTISHRMPPSRDKALPLDYVPQDDDKATNDPMSEFLAQRSKLRYNGKTILIEKQLQPL